MTHHEQQLPPRCWNLCGWTLAHCCCLQTANAVQSRQAAPPCASNETRYAAQVKTIHDLVHPNILRFHNWCAPCPALCTAPGQTHRADKPHSTAQCPLAELHHSVLSIRSHIRTQHGTAA